MRNVEIDDMTAKKLIDICEVYSLNLSDVVNDLVDNYLDKLVKDYGLIEGSDCNTEPYPCWSEEFLNTLGMSKNDF